MPVELGNGTVRFDMRNEDCALNCCDLSKCQRACHDPSRTMCVPWVHVRSYALSTDSGRTFGSVLPDRALPDPATDAGCQASMMRDAGSLYFTNPRNASLRVDMTLQVSSDDGGHWAPRALVPKGRPSGYSCLTTLQNRSRVGVLWEDCANCIAGGRVVFASVPK